MVVSEHAKHSPSSLHRWGLDRCPGCLNLCEGLPDISGPAAREGTRAHKVLESILGVLYKLPHNAPAKDIQLRQESAYGVDCALKRIGELGRIGMQLLAVELKVAVSKQVWGTADIVGYLPVERRLLVYDYKNGVIPVTARNQLKTYGLGAYEVFKDHLQIEGFGLGVIQPNSNNGKYYSYHPYTIPEILDHKLYVHESVEATIPMTASRRPGYWCQWCVGQPYCPEFQSTQADPISDEIDDKTLKAMTMYNHFLKTKQ